jgi:hypothetical protein
MSGDVINFLFELIGGILNWMNVLKLHKDKEVKGVFYPAWIFFAAWGLWNIYYYPSLGQWWSFWGGLVIVSANLYWVGLVIYYKVKGVSK